MCHKKVGAVGNYGQCPFLYIREMSVRSLLISFHVVMFCSWGFERNFAPLGFARGIVPRRFAPGIIQLADIATLRLQYLSFIRVSL
jgi:hypothetical protein